MPEHEKRRKYSIEQLNIKFIIFSKINEYLPKYNDKTTDILPYISYLSTCPV